MISTEDAERLLFRTGCSQSVIDHCHAVCALAEKYCTRPDIDCNLVRVGALLHDIGRCQSHRLDHGIIGADICRNEGLPEEVARIVECHVGVGLTAEECVELGLPPRNCVPLTIEEKIVAHADNLLHGETILTIEERLSRANHLPEKKRKEMVALAEEVEALRTPSA